MKNWEGKKVIWWSRERKQEYHGVGVFPRHLWLQSHPVNHSVKWTLIKCWVQLHMEIIFQRYLKYHQTDWVLKSRERCLHNRLEQLQHGSELPPNETPSINITLYYFVKKKQCVYYFVYWQLHYVRKKAFVTVLVVWNLNTI